MVRAALNPKYIAVLAGVSVLVLAVGALLRPNHDDPAVVALSERVTFTDLSQRGEFRRMSDYLSNRAAVLAPYVVRLDAQGTTGLVWGSTDTVLVSPAAETPEAGPVETPVAALLDPVARGPAPAPALAFAPVPSQTWVMLLARRQGGSVLSSATLTGGAIPIECGHARYHEVLLGVPLDPAFEGGAVFDLDGGLVGVVTQCRGRRMVLAAGDIAGALGDGLSARVQLVRRHGIQVDTLTQEARRYFGATEGLLISGVRTGPSGSPFQPGDVLIAAGTSPVRRLEDLLFPQAGGDTVSTFTVWRAGRTLQVAATREPPGTSDLGTGMGFAGPPSGVAITRVVTGSEADRAGLRAGDTLLRVGPIPVRSPAAIPSLLRRPRPLYLVFQRGAWRHGVLVS
jgi:PDZ domain